MWSRTSFHLPAASSEGANSFSTSILLIYFATESFYSVLKKSGTYMDLTSLLHHNWMESCSSYKIRGLVFWLWLIIPCIGVAARSEKTLRLSQTCSLYQLQHHCAWRRCEFQVSYWLYWPMLVYFTHIMKQLRPHTFFTANKGRSCLATCLRKFVILGNLLLMKSGAWCSIWYAVSSRVRKMDLFEILMVIF